MSSVPIPTAPADEHDQMSFVERVVFAAGDVFGGGGAALLNVLYFFFLTDVVGLQPGWAGAVVATAKVVDAVARPVMGQLTDNTRTAWGRRRPWLVVGAVLIVVAYLLLWLPVSGWGQGARAAFALATVVFYTLVGVMVTVPYASMSTETTTSLAERNRLNLMRLGFSTLASALVFVGATALVQAYKSGGLSAWVLYLVLALGFGLLFAVPVAAVGLWARERTPVPAGRERFRVGRFTLGFRVPEFRALLWLYLCSTLMMDGIGYLLLAYTTYVAKVQTALFMAIIILINLGFVVVSQRLVRTVSKNRIYATLLPVGVVAGAAVALWPGTWPAWPVYVLVVGLAVGIAGTQMMPWVMFPDVVDATELALGRRDAGSLSGLMAFVRSLVSAVLVLTIGLVLQALGYRGKEDGRTVLEQPDAAVWGIRVVLLLLVAGLGTLGWFLARRYPLTRSVCAQQAAELIDRRSA